MFYTRGGPGMGLLLDDPRLPLAGALVLLLVTGQLLWRVRRRRLVRRQRAEAILRAPPGLGRAPGSGRPPARRGARASRAAAARARARGRPAPGARNCAADRRRPRRIRRMHDPPSSQAPRPVSAVPTSTTGP